MSEPSKTSMQSECFANPSIHKGYRSTQRACKEQTLRSEHAKQSPIYICFANYPIRRTGGGVVEEPPTRHDLPQLACRGNTSFKKKNFNPRLCFVQVGQTNKQKEN